MFRELLFCHFRAAQPVLAKKNEDIFSLRSSFFEDIFSLRVLGETFVPLQGKNLKTYLV